MAITTTIEGSEATITIEGWLDTQTAPELAAALAELDGSVKSLTLDLAALEYISSAGVRQIVAALKKMRGALTLANVQPEVYEVLRLTGVVSRLNIV
jgi:anti-anti-sigma factor